MVQLMLKIFCIFVVLLRVFDVKVEIALDALGCLWPLGRRFEGSTYVDRTCDGRSILFECDILAGEKFESERIHS
jgi:hypothetical protein